MNLKDLETALRTASNAYYNQSPNQSISDEDFDALRDELATKDPNNAFLKEIGAPIQIGAWPKAKHRHVMGSQEKVKNREEFDHWFGTKSYCVITDKLDGSTIAIIYKNGQLISGITRGDGLEGEDITPNVLQMENVKECLEGFSGTLRAEMNITLSTFNTHFAPNGYKNPRNAANGVARDKKGSNLITKIRVTYFDVIAPGIKTESDKKKLIEGFGLDYVYVKGPFGKEQIWKVFEARVQERPTLDYEIDGMVVKIDNLEEQHSYGSHDARPRGQVAIKFVAQSKEARVADIQWQVGRNGRITPVATLDPTEIGGVTITRCTLNNIDYMNTLGVSVDATVVLTRANDVIPAITGVTKPGNGVTNQPTNCSLCNNTLEREGAYLLCTMIDCQGKAIGSVMTWLRATKIRGVGPAVLKGLVDLGIDDPAKLCTAPLSVFVDACNSDKNGAKVYQQVQASLEMPLSTFLYGLNVELLGRTNSKRLEKKFGDLDSVLAAGTEDFGTVPGIKTTAKKLYDAIREKEDLIAELRKAVKFKTMSQQGILAGKSFCVTGQLSKSRDEIHDLIRNSGGDIKTGVSKGLDYLIMADPTSNSSKANKARKYGTRCINEIDLLKMI